MYRYKVSRHKANPDTILAWSPVQAKLEARRVWASRGQPAPLGVKITATRKHKVSTETNMQTAPDS